MILLRLDSSMCLPSAQFARAGSGGRGGGGNGVGGGSGFIMASQVSVRQLDVINATVSRGAGSRSHT